MRKRKIQRWAHSWIIKLEPADMEDLGLQEGDTIDIDDIVIKNKKKRQEK